MSILIQISTRRFKRYAMLDNSKTNGRWTKEQHEKFILGLQLYGKDWKKIEALVATRNGAQIRSHAQKFFIKIQKETEPTENHDNWEQTKQTPLDDLAQNFQNSISYQQPETKPEYSYYLNKIVQKSSKNESFDFWENLIDTKKILESQIQLRYKRKNSFVSVCSGESQEEIHTRPFKRFKAQ